MPLAPLGFDDADTLGTLQDWAPTALRFAGATPLTAPLGELAAQSAEGGPRDLGAAAMALGLSVIPLGAAVGAGARRARAAISPAVLARGRALLGRFETSTIGRILNETRARGGYSVNLATGDVPKQGLFVGTYANTDPRNIVLDPRTMPQRATVAAHAGVNAKALTRHDKYFGTWIDEDTGKLYFDVSQWFPDWRSTRKAIKFGERTGQLTGYDAASRTLFPIGDWDAFVKSDEFQERLTAMAKVGREYLQQYGGKEWWDIKGTSLERVYGKENMEVVAGLIASTSPGQSPRENLRVFSEYMRRVLAGEPVLQKGWRVKPGEMRDAGKQLWAEKSHRANLLKAAKGEWWNLRKDKVREMAAAELGNPTAFVGDRWWARIAEAPLRGILTGVSEGTLPPGKAYALLKEQVALGAQRAGRPLRDFSADVWTGIRETVLAHGELFGVPYNGLKGAGPSKGLADQFDDLVAAKARFLGISVEEMEARLRGGQANLLAWLLATPAVAGLYARSADELFPQPAPAPAAEQPLP